MSASRMLVVSMAFAASGSCARQVAPTPVLLPPVPVAVAGVVSTPNREPLLATVRLSFTDRQLAKVLTDKTGRFNISLLFSPGVDIRLQVEADEHLSYGTTLTVPAEGLNYRDDGITLTPGNVRDLLGHR